MDWKPTIFLIILTMSSLSCEDMIFPEGYRFTTPEAIAYSLSQLESSLDEISPDHYPIRTRGNGIWDVTSASAWTSGFFPGCLWYAFELSQDSSWIQHAVNFTVGLEDQQYNTNHHDTGFMIFNSYGNGYRITKNAEYKDVIIQAAHSLATRYNDNVKCIQSWNGEFQVIIDNLMNLEILFWASRHGGGGELYDMAVNHAGKTVENHLRGDGSSYHVVVYDPQTGKVLEKRTAQGFSTNSTWARGQAWGIYGFTMCYRETRDKMFLDSACKMADYFLDHLPGDQVPFWDLELPASSTRQYRDASAAAIAASGLKELSTYAQNGSKYYKASRHILYSLIQSYLSYGTESSGMILHCAYNVNSSNPYDWDASTIWGDYYFLETLKRHMIHDTY
jgi:unsaturated chondroitin disaccharide hydrolase